jgi:hypothetical protein
MSWTRWKQFPNPRKFGELRAPFGPGVYELRRKSNKKLVLFGISANCAKRMTSLLPSNKGGSGGRNNIAKRNYVDRNLSDIEYRTCPTKTKADAKAIEDRMKSRKHLYSFKT